MIRPHHSHPSHQRMCRSLAAFALLSAATPAYGATWAGGRTTPTLREVVAVDGTGEPGWPYGAEDLAGDGVASFKPAEQSIDIRTAYAAADPQRFWARVYVSDTQPAGGNVHAFVFIDADANAATGGTAVAPEVDAHFTSDDSPGGYEHVLQIDGNGASVELWTWTQNRYLGTQLPPARVTGEVGTDTDPIRLGSLAHGYLQASVELLAVGLTQACNANLYVRTVNDTASLGAGDLEVGQVGTCIPRDANGNGVPDVLVPTGCTSNAECPGGGICQAGECILARACTTNADCGAGMQCTPDGRCVPVPAGACTSTAQCNDLVCTGGQCVACTPGGTECGAGNVCAPDGRCIADQGAGGGNGSGAGDGGLSLTSDEAVKGGACHCALSSRSTLPAVPSACIGALAWLFLRRRASRRR